MRYKLLTYAILSTITLGFINASVAYAMTPTLSLSNVGGGSLLMSVSGDPNAVVMFYYNIGSSSGMQMTTIGNTNSSGLLSTTINTSSYAINPGSSVYILINSQQSSMSVWPSTTPSGAPSLSQNNITLVVGQNIAINISGGGGSYNINDNSNLTAISTVLNGNTITVNSITSGSANITICDQSGGCGTINVTVMVH